MIVDDLDAIAGHLAETPLAGLLALWRQRAADKLPAWRDFDVLEMRPWLGRLSLVELFHAEKDILWRVFGTKVAEMLQRDMTGVRFSERPDLVPANVHQTYWRVADDGKPLLHMVTRREVDEPLVGMVRLLLPLSEHGRQVDMVMTGYDESSSVDPGAAPQGLG